MGQGNLNPHNVPIDEFFEKRKEQMLERAQEMGLDYFAVQDFINDKGLVSLSEDIIFQFHSDPTYQNPLKRCPPLS